MAKLSPQPDVLVLGEHPAAYLAAALLRDKPTLNVTHATIPGERARQRLVIVNPSFFPLHTGLDKVRKKMSLTGVWGVTFVSDKAETRGDYRAKSAVGFVGCYDDVRRATAEVAKAAGVKLLTPTSMSIVRIDERGLLVEMDGVEIQAKAMLLAGDLAPEDGRKLRLPEPWAADQLRRYSFVRLRCKPAEIDNRPIIPMSLDLGGQLTWAWMLPGTNEVQLAVEHPPGNGNGALDLLKHWVEVLTRHGMMKAGDCVEGDEVRTMEIPAAGALVRECVWPTALC